MNTASLFYKMRLGLLGVLGFGSLISCDPPKMYGPAPLMYGPAPDMYGPPTELLPDSEQPEAADEPDTEVGSEDASK